MFIVFVLYFSEAKVHKQQDEEFHSGEGRKLCQDHDKLWGEINTFTLLLVYIQRQTLFVMYKMKLNSETPTDTISRYF